MYKEMNTSLKLKSKLKSDKNDWTVGLPEETYIALLRKNNQNKKHTKSCF